MFKALKQNWKYYFESVKEFGVNLSKYKEKTIPPKFKNKNQIIFTNLAIRYDNGLSKSIKSLFNVESLNF